MGYDVIYRISTDDREHVANLERPQIWDGGRSTGIQREESAGKMRDKTVARS